VLQFPCAIAASPSTIVAIPLAPRLQRRGQDERRDTAMTALLLAPLLWAIAEIAAVVLLSRAGDAADEGAPLEDFRPAA
jgi:hypothetical protein